LDDPRVFVNLLENLGILGVSRRLCVDLRGFRRFYDFHLGFRSL